ncbi:MAG: histone deacetylase [Bacteroidales bacterium]|nr:histone deacetylase [Bacteroidales bacterium]MCF8333915.1 histone deacetylase [Bacteroidales bacterium]
MEKYSLIPQQLLHEGTYTKEHFFVPDEPATDVIRAVHDEDYIYKLNTGRLHKLEERRIGFPWSHSLIRREEHICAGTLQGALLALDNGVAFNIAGGTHHAYRDRGEGFCIYNDIAIASQYLLDKKMVRQVLVVDLDVHQGNGTARIFEKEPRVFTFSMHGAKNYPLHKEHSDLDLALGADITDKEYLDLLRKNLTYLIDHIVPDIIFFQSGVDILADDRLGKLSISKSGIRERDRIVLENAYRRNIPVIASMGGGYSRHIRNIVDAHCNIFRMAKDMWE